VIFIYLIFAKDWKSISHMLLMSDLFSIKYNSYLGECYTRAAIVALNEFVIFKIATSTNIGEDRAIGLIVNFGAALIICELDDILMETDAIQKLREQYDN
jgi:hypothetical protein